MHAHYTLGTASEIQQAVIPDCADKAGMHGTT